MAVEMKKKYLQHLFKRMSHGCVAGEWQNDLKMKGN